MNNLIKSKYKKIQDLSGTLEKLTAAHKSLKKNAKWSEDELVAFMKTFDKFLNPNIEHLLSSHPVFRKKDDLLRPINWGLLQKKFKASTTLKLLNPDSYFFSPFYLKNITASGLNTIFKKPRYQSLLRTPDLFFAVIRAQDTEKLKLLYKNGNPAHFTEADRSSHRDAKLYQEALSFAVSQGDKELVKNVLKSSSFFMWSDIKEIRLKAFASGSLKLNPKKYLEIKALFPELSATRKLYDQLCLSGLSEVFSKHQVLTFNLHDYLAKNFYCHHYHDPHLVDYSSFGKFLRKEAKTFEMVGNRRMLHDDNSRKYFNDRYKPLLLEFKKAIETNKNSIEAFRPLVQYQPNEYLHWISETHTYFSALVLLNANKISKNFYTFYKERVESPKEWSEALTARLVEVDNLKVFSLIETKGRELEFAKIAAVFKSADILKHLTSKLTGLEKKELARVQRIIKVKKI